MTEFNCSTCCDGGIEFPGSRKMRCGECDNCKQLEIEANNKKIEKKVLIQSGLRTMNLGALSVMGTYRKPWNNQSDRPTPAMKMIHGSRGNSIRGTRTSLKPGASSVGGVGVDVKHNSYDRYLAKKKNKFLRKDLTNSKCKCT